MTGRVLIVDDSLTVRMDLAEAFEAADVEVSLAESLAEARRAVAAGNVALVVLDVMLPDGDGVEFLKELRATYGASLPVLMLSSEAEVSDRIRGIRMGANEYVGKPYEARYVVTRARELTGRDESAPPRPSVLVIDDSETFRRALCEALEAAGYRAYGAIDGRTGLEMLADRRPDAVIVDGIMPDMDGASLIRRVRLDAATRSIPCLLLTASEEGGAQLRALEAGADAFVRKDGDMEIILARLGAVMRQLQERPAGPVASLAASRRILAVDDSLTYLNELSDALRQDGYDVLQARSGEEALELLAVQAVDCILMDLVMPGMGGKEACVRIKAAPGVREIPLILLTAMDDRIAMLDGLSAGADDYISKSSEFEVLSARVLAQIRRKQFEDENRRYREELLSRELEANDERAARVLAEARAAMVDELERKVEERTKELQATIIERRHAERMASVGMLSASIAHEINNPLAVVTGNLELLELGLKDLAGDPAVKMLVDGLEDGIGRQLFDRLGTPDDPLRDALEAAERVREIVRDLKMFSRSEGEDTPTSVDVHKVIDSAIRMASNEIRHRAKLVRDFGSVPQVIGSESRLGQVFLNLIVNAAQAMPVGQVAGNEIRISTRVDAGGHVAIAFADTGVGIAADKLAKVFEPFFTTKPAGVGTGLGLAICHRIVTELGGTMEVESEISRGTVFTAKLRPASPATTIGAVSADSQRPEAAQAHGRVLIVDDEPALLKMIERMLEREHEVVGVSSAAAAVALFDKGERFDVILSDLMMPEMTGMDLHAALSRSVPEQAARMIFMSGGALSPDAVKFFDEQANPTLDKPFPPKALRQAIASLLGRRPAGDARSAAG
jgi:DNA-binding response OmpR family regulator